MYLYTHRRKCRSSSRSWVRDKDSGVIIIEGMVKTSESYRKCIESKKSAEQRTESQTTPNTRNTNKKNVRENRELQDVNRKNPQRKGREN